MPYCIRDFRHKEVADASPAVTFLFINQASIWQRRLCTYPSVLIFKILYLLTCCWEEPQWKSLWEKLILLCTTLSTEHIQSAVSTSTCTVIDIFTLHSLPSSSFSSFLPSFLFFFPFCTLSFLLFSPSSLHSTFHSSLPPFLSFFFPFSQVKNMTERFRNLAFGTGEAKKKKHVLAKVPDLKLQVHMFEILLFTSWVNLTWISVSSSIK